ncbi:serine O-acetyltransferase [Gammaproteobacteria bacterium LSUCC0057]|uniref:Serine acetyltransferase n=1 Tax=Gammaproteobacteria bacterium LSUCC0057 TaxID=2559237 RepID=A0A4Y8UFU5_9GAMM|nr:serine O-acetyltransferase [Gammaproteobacteria bacterium LSUCC0057]
MTVETPSVEQFLITLSAELELLQDPLLQPLVAHYRRCATPLQGLADYLSGLVASEQLAQPALAALLLEQYALRPLLLEQLVADSAAYIDRDPACQRWLEPLLFFKGFQALQLHRVAHVLYLDGRCELASLLQSRCSEVFAVDIHPAAVIGRGIMLDHATGLVIGETAVVGDDVSILHAVTLGGSGRRSGDRHPKVGSGVMIAAGAQLLGNIRIGDGAKIGAGSVVLNDVPAHVTVAGVPARIVGAPRASAPALSMDQQLEESE